MLIVALTACALAVRASIVFCVVAWLCVMLGGSEINIARAKLNTTITKSDRVFLLDMFLVARLNIPIIFYLQIK
jgi:hypothetical protein